MERDFYHYCTHPAAEARRWDAVLGFVAHDALCSDVRATGPCGPDGNLFERPPPLPLWPLWLLCALAALCWVALALTRP